MPTPKYTRAAIDLSASGDIIAAVANRGYRVVHIMGLSGGTGTVTIRSASTNLTGAMDFVAGGGFRAKDYEAGVFIANLGESLNVVIGGSATFKGFVIYEIIGD